MHRLREAGNRVRILFLDASTPELVKRYGATRRKHPLAHQHTSIAEAIDYERMLLEPVKGSADLVIDTSDLNVHQLKSQIVELFSSGEDSAGMQVSVTSFGFKHGIPLDVDMVLDVRFLPNLHWEESLRTQTGLDDAVRHYVLDRPLSRSFLEQIHGLLGLLLPAYESEGKSYLTIAIGCTGGRHRSVAIATELGEWLTSIGQHPRVTHRDISR